MANEVVRDEHAEAWLSGGGSMGELMRSIDWSKTPIGAVETWSQALRTMVRILLVNRFPILLWWGPAYIQIYNDAYRPIPGSKHPASMGQAARECWSEIWEVIGPLIDTPFKGGSATWIEDLELEIHRSGFTEETHFTVAYSPVPDETAPTGIGGVLATVHEITEKVVSQRRIGILRELGTRAAEAKTAEEACTVAAATLAAHPKDVPFALLYVIDASAKIARLAARSGVIDAADINLPIIDLEELSAAAGWPFAEASNTGETQLINELSPKFTTIPHGPWSNAPGAAAVIPIRSNTAHQFSGFLVAGLSSRLKFDEGYRNFLELAAAQIATSVANAQAYQEERRRAEALAEIDRAKTVFFSNVSHEFRTPLTLMLGPLESVLAKTTSLPPEDREQLDIAHRNSLRLLKLVNSLLDFSRIEADRVRASFAAVDLSVLTADLASNFRSAMQAGGLDLIVDCPPLPEPVYVDREMWEKIVLNLLSNAFKFTFEGTVTVQMKAEDGQAVLTVSDTGIGIPAAELPHIFERFHRVEGARGRSYEGTGIGLALIQELVKIHAGSISVVSNPSEGSSFEISLPFGAAHLPKDLVGGEALAQVSTASRREAYTVEALTWLSEGIETRTAMGVASAAGVTAGGPEARTGTENGRRARILVADDNADMRDYISRVLGPDYELVAVPDGIAALEQARRTKPDLILSDVMMPTLGGFELLHELRGDPHLCEVPVILLSARAGEEARIEGVAAGADDYLTKPFSARELTARVDTRLELVRSRQKAGADRGRLAAIVEYSDDAIVSKDLNGVILSWNAGAERLFGYTAPEAIGQPVTMLIPPDRADEEPGILKRIRHGQRVEPYETIRRRKDGTLVDISLTVSPIVDEHGQIVGASKIARDITERRRMEQKERELAVATARREIEAELARVARALTIGELATSIAHEVNQPLAAIVTNAEAGLRWLKAKAPKLHEAQQSLELIVRDGNRASEVIRRIREFLRKDSPETAPLDINDVAQEAIALVRDDLLKRKITLIVELSEELPPIRGDRIQLQQVLLNLIMNGSEAINSVADGSRELVVISQKSGADSVLLAVRDSGAGVEPEIVGRMFQAFFTTKPTGMGLGLAISRSIIEAHGGRIWAVPNEGPGLTVQFTLPIETENP